MNSDVEVTFGAPLRRATRKPAGVKPAKPVVHTVDCDAAWSAYSDALRKDGRAMVGLEPTYTGPVAAARSAYVEAATICLA